MLEYVDFVGVLRGVLCDVSRMFDMFFGVRGMGILSATTGELMHALVISLGKLFSGGQVVGGIDVIGVKADAGGSMTVGGAEIEGDITVDT